MPFDATYLDKRYYRYYYELSDFDTRLQCLYDIIQIKINNPTLKNVKRTLYIDVKDWIHSYLNFRIEKDFGYDSFDKRQIIDVVKNSHFSSRQIISLFEYIKIELINRKSNFTWIDSLILNEKLLIFKRENFFKYLLVLSGKSKLSCIVTLSLLYMLECLVLLPDFFESSLFSIDYVDYYDGFIFNHILNVLALRLPWIEGPKLHCLDAFSVILCAFWATLYVVFVANILFKNLFDNIDLNEI